MKLYWFPHEGPLRYVGDGHDRLLVVPAWTEEGPVMERFYGQQKFRWPDGSEHFVPVYAVVKDSPTIRWGLGLEAGDEVKA